MQSHRLSWDYLKIALKLKKISNTCNWLMGSWLWYQPQPNEKFSWANVFTHKNLWIEHYKDGFLFLTEFNCTVLKERLKSGQNCTENQPLRIPEGLTSRTRLIKVIEAKTLAYHIRPHNDFVYQFQAKSADLHFQVCPDLSGRSS